MSKRKHISWKTKCAAALVHCDIIPRDQAKLLEEDQLLSLFQWHHNEFYTLDSDGRDKFWNLVPMLIKAHRARTKQDAKIIAKSKRIRRRQDEFMAAAIVRQTGQPPATPFLYDAWERRQRKMQSRGFDKRYRKKMDGTVVKR